jgi:hypothetical protein
MERSIILSDTLANRLEHYLQEHPDESVSDLIEEILQQKENPSGRTSRILRIQPAKTGSGYSDTSVNHDEIFADTAGESQ